MEVRKVQKQDIQGIKEIADSLRVTFESRNRDSGFYNYCLTFEQYQRRSESGLFLVATCNWELEGFCMAYDSEFVKRLIAQEPQLKNDVVFNYLNNLSENYIYVDQIAVRQPKSYISRLSAYKLVNKLRELSLGNDAIIGVVPHYPWKNGSAIKFHEHLGTKLVREIGSQDKIVFGVYRKNLV